MDKTLIKKDEKETSFKVIIDEYYARFMFKN